MCLWALLRRKTDAFAMSFERVCGVKRDVFAALFRRKTEVFATRLQCICSEKARRI